MAVTVDRVRSTEELVELLEARPAPELVMFWGHRPPVGGGIGSGCLSQWWPAHFAADGITYRSAEQYMMAQKALLFGDAETAAQIRAATNPVAARQLGRKVARFDEQTWASRRFGIVITGNLAKFSQKPDLTAFLLRTAGKVLVHTRPTPLQKPRFRR
jgi:ribA/ribD-fused uncharacterized protein